MEPVIDWLSITVKHRKDTPIPASSRLNLDMVLIMLHMWSLKPFFIPMKGIHRYQLRYSYQGITINEPYEDRLDGDGTSEKSGMGYNITMSGSGLRFFLDYHRRENSSFNLKLWLEYLSTFHLYEIKCSRIDIALDDVVKVSDGKSPCLDFDSIMSCVNAGHLKTRAKTMGVVQKDSYRINKDSDTGFCKPEPMGKTIYFGSRKSEKYIRIYDKLSEQRQKNPEDKALKDLSNWIRCETEYKGDTAQEILKMYMGDNWEKTYCSHLMDMLSFVDDQGNALPWWSTFCKNAAPYHLRVRRKHVDTGDFIRIRNTFFYQMGRNALTVMLGLGPDEFYSQLLYEESRLKKRHWSILQGYQHDKLLDTPSFNDPSFYSPPVEQLSIESILH